MLQPADDLPRRKAATGNFRRGQPRAVSVYPSGADWRVRYLAGSGPRDPVGALHELASDGTAAVLADPAILLADDDEDLPAAERARRERLREGGAGITAYTTDKEGVRSAFALSGRLWVVDSGANPVEVPTASSVVDPRISPDGLLIAYHADGDVHVVTVDTGNDSVLCAAESPQQHWGLAEFIAAEEMGRFHGMWWCPDSEKLLVAHVDESEVGTWWIGDPARPDTAPRAVRYPAAGTPNATVALWLVGLSGLRHQVVWDADRYPYLASVHMDSSGALVSVQTRDQTQVLHLHVDLSDATATQRGAQQRSPWVELVPGSPRLAPDGALVVVEADDDADAWRLRRGPHWATPPDLYVRSLLRCDGSGIWLSASRDPTQNHLFRVHEDGGIEQVTRGAGWHTPLAAGPVPVIATSTPSTWQPAFTVGDPRSPAALLANTAESPAGEPRVQFIAGQSAVRVAVVLPPGGAAAPVIVSSYGGPHAQRVVRAPLSFAAEQWFADCGFAVVVVDGRGSPGVSPSCEAAIAGDLAGPVLADQIAGLAAAQQAHPERLDLSRVGIRGWSFGGYLAALAVLRRPDVFHAAFAGAPVTQWRLYDTHYTERYLGRPDEDPTGYDNSSLLPLAAGLERPLCLVHGMADDNVVAAHTLQLSAALTAHGRRHEVLPLPGVSHMTPQESITENLLRLERDFFLRCLARRPSSK